MPGIPLLLAAAMALAVPAAAEYTTADLRAAGYFEFLDYDNPAIAARIPAYDARLRARAAEKSDPLDPDSALFLVYAGLYIANTDYGVRAGRVDLKALQAAGRVAAEDGAKAELVARETLALSFFERARAALKDDKRIEGWAAGARVRIDAFRDGKPSADSVSQMLFAAEAYPLFNLFSGLILAQEHDLGPEAEERLFALVQKMTSKEGPCREPGARCGSSALAPFADQGAAALMGDAYFKRAVARLRDADGPNDKEGYHDAGMALILYTAPYLKTPFKTRRWTRLESMGRRSEMARALMSRREAPADDMKSPALSAVHHCASCHSTK